MPQGLGRGLGSLIPKKTVTYGRNPFKAEATDEELAVLLDNDRIFKINPAKILINPHQPRTDFSTPALDDLAESIREHGIIQPLVVTRKGEGFELIAGERRLRAAALVGLKEVPVIVREEKEQKKLELALIENLQREDLNPLEIARAYQKLVAEFNITQEEVAKKVGKARSSVANALRLLSLPEAILEALASRKISEAHAKFLLGLGSEVQQLNMLKKIMRQNLTVAQTDKEIKRIGGTKAARVKNYLDEEREQELAGLLGTKVEIRRQGKSGKILIDFYSEEELEGIVKKIQ